ncbi:hydroxyethylthiazole kinase [[Clostridium] sordellii]|uniref:Hydroxyethylthiazole kinase n=1 Tax=Paraclostridium sordellii TaxID=1505 RepID=A0ABM9RLR4_PARSO|nr:hydroxyethylthiazole kinase [Paeniclostridium sordellii]CEJ72946.1 Hydroxyethylthiazole kinase [[Clostridium] sordellii] [Paeniclostridium sordellii]CEN68499.1 hydroxyethylthiazole kinase [[Clostridium] sordellii] [Paeniclostridium sordellii]CEN71766.1 hydroxyethylthiazole kinase [[Clostridium] sordellii] [Paeniclostridium sordellii]CEO22300.1 hydroxyethylthiazole kinase [[Clostridium] sordellii] [Paeniclostridium sordellii]CEP76641.1 hydroxyethylthiazole kinase [[Clostridium] sordellii] [P
MFNLLSKVREVNPLVLHYTNEVTINDCANITLALGASPLMSYSYEEIEEIIPIASCVVINIGTMNSSHTELFLKAGKIANKFNKPVVLDPVGVFATKSRALLVEKLLNEVKFDVIKGNASEIKYIGGFDVKGKGVDSFEEDENIDDIIKKVAKKLECVVASTGKIDVITDGEKVIKIDNGSSKLKSITGTGCMSASLIGSYLGISENKLESASMGILTMSLCGELADKDNIGIGSFKVSLMDNIYSLNKETLNKFSRVEVL